MDIHTKDGTNALNTNLDKGAKDVSKSLNAIKNTTNTDMGSANNAMQQNATTMYKGVSTSFYKMEQKAKQSSTDMMKGVNTSTHKMANESLKVRQSASEMYKGVTTSTRKMADAAISDWNRVRKAYSKPITGTVTKTTVNKSISAQSKVRSIPTNNDIPTIASLEPTYQLRTPDISDFAISSRYYNSSYSERVSIS